MAEMIQQPPSQLIRLLSHSDMHVFRLRMVQTRTRGHDVLVALSLSPSGNKFDTSIVANTTISTDMATRTILNPSRLERFDMHRINHRHI
eukprot:183112-Amphidinium_carterae.1